MESSAYIGAVQRDAVKFEQTKTEWRLWSESDKLLIERRHSMRNGPNKAVL